MLVWYPIAVGVRLASIANAIVVDICLIRVGGDGAVVYAIWYAIIVVIVVAGITLAIVVAIELSRVSDGWAVIDSVRNHVAIGIDTSIAWIVRAGVTTVRNAVAITIIVTGIADTIAISISLCFVGD